uniref:Ribonuclease Z n=1 Tax=Taenioma perpusillum TaxID=210852 RepID=A0A1Z1MRN9_9FLOR|nr:ribonuclease Z [Taenioma perpusillum]ARW68425.1 ribonuclease Z [Taenioma perpusillum]
METNFFDSSINSFEFYDINFIIKFFSSKDIWIFNCFEGCQYFITNNKFRINNISKIIFANMHINNISGLLGLLSSLNLIGRTKSIHIYAPQDLLYYIKLLKKYSHTNFNFSIYVHVLTTGLIINSSTYRVYSFIYKFKCHFIIIEQEKFGTFNIQRAKNNLLIPSPLYNQLKKGSSFILPDGYILNGNNFTCVNILGRKLSFFFDRYCTRINLEKGIYDSNIIY